MSRNLVAGCSLLVFCCLTSVSDAGEATLVIENARVIVGDGRVKSVASIVVEGDRIQSVPDAPPGIRAAETIDGRHLTVMPGLIDTHVHIFAGNLTGSRGRGEKAFRDELAKDVPQTLKEYLRHGITTVKSTGDPLSLILELRGLLRSGHLVGPRLLVVGSPFTAPDGHPASTILKDDPWWRSEQSIEIDTPEKARDQVRRVATKGVDAIKAVYHGSPSPDIFPGETKVERLDRDVMKAIIDEAHQHKLRATVHTWREQDAVEALQAGADALEHGVADAGLVDDRLSEILRGRGAFYVPTLRVLRFSKAPKTLQIGKENLKRLADRGVRIALGTDTVGDFKDTPPGLNTLKEMEFMAEAGLAPESIIRAATRDAAEHIGLLGDLGTVEAGKLADLIVVDGDPLADISAIERIQIVVQAGRIVYKAGAK